MNISIDTGDNPKIGDSIRIFKKHGLFVGCGHVVSVDQTSIVVNNIVSFCSREIPKILPRTEYQFLIDN